MTPTPPTEARMSIDCLLWDFGNTLCHETFIWSSGPEWKTLYRSFDEGIGRAWNCLLYTSPSPRD